MCVSSCVCKWLSSGFIRLQWCLDSRKSSTNRTEWCRNGQKAPLEFLKLIFSLLPFTLSLFFNHSLIFLPPLFSLSSSRCSFLHQHRSAFSALAVTRSWCCSTNFSSLYSCYSASSQKHFWVSGGKLLASDYSYMVISPCFAHLSVCFRSLSFYYLVSLSFLHLLSIVLFFLLFFFKNCLSARVCRPLLFTY